MSLRRLSFASSVLVLGLTAIACDQPEPGDQDQTLEAVEIDDIEGAACEDIESSAMCLDGERQAFCSDFPGGAVEYGPCLMPEEIACMPGDHKSVPTGANLEEEPWECSHTNYWCVLDNGVPRWEEDPCITPLVLDFDTASPIEMVTAESPPMASFDINVDGGSCLATDWPSAATPWLVFDRDGNGSIDDGRELFGSGTRMADGRAADHGFSALAELDSNADGKLDARDQDFDKLMLWRDWDADRLSTHAELEPLASAGVDSLDLGFEVRRSCDTRGNCGVQRSEFKFEGGRVGELVDLYLACQ